MRTAVVAAVPSGMRKNDCRRRRRPLHLFRGAELVFLRGRFRERVIVKRKIGRVRAIAFRVAAEQVAFTQAELLGPFSQTFEVLSVDRAAQLQTRRRRGRWFDLFHRVTRRLVRVQRSHFEISVAAVSERRYRADDQIRGETSERRVAKMDGPTRFVRITEPNKYRPERQ